MSIRKDDLYKLVDEMDDKEATLAYKIIKGIMKDKRNLLSGALEADNTPLSEEEKTQLAEVIKEETVDWEDVKRELNL